MHWFAAKPHALGMVLVDGTQVLPWQQPLQLMIVQVGAAHAPFAHTFVPQFTHALPLDPQLALVCVVTHTLPWQQPLGHVLGEQPAI